MWLNSVEKVTELNMSNYVNEKILAVTTHSTVHAEVPVGPYLILRHFQSNNAYSLCSKK